MHAHAYYLIGLLCIYMGIRFALKGNKIGSRPRTINGIAIALIGVAQFFRTIPLVGIAIIAIGLITFAVSLIMLKNELSQKQ